MIQLIRSPIPPAAPPHRRTRRRRRRRIVSSHSDTHIHIFPVSVEHLSAVSTCFCIIIPYPSGVLLMVFLILIRATTDNNDYFDAPNTFK